MNENYEQLHNNIMYFFVRHGRIAWNKEFYRFIVLDDLFVQYADREGLLWLEQTL